MNHWIIYINWFIQTSDSFRNKAFDCVNEWITESFWSTDSIKHLIHSETKHLTVLMSESLNHLFNRFNQTSDSFRNKAFDCVNEWITESFQSTDSIKGLIHSGRWHITTAQRASVSVSWPVPLFSCRSMLSVSGLGAGHQEEALQRRCGRGKAQI